MFKLTKRSITALLALILVFSLVALFACSQTGNDTDGSETENDPVNDDVFSTTPMVSGFFVLRTDGTVWVLSPYWTMENSDDFDVSLAKQVAGLDNIVYIDFNIALRDDGTVWEIFDIEDIENESNLDGGYLAQLLNPTQIQGVSDVVAISHSGAHMLALQSDGTVWSWGINDFGQLGDGTTEERNTPKQVMGLPLITKVVTPPWWDKSFALCENGNVWAWGQGMNPNASSTDSKEQRMALVPMEIPSLPSINFMSNVGHSSIIFICEKGQIYYLEIVGHLNFTPWTGKYNNVAACTEPFPISICDQGNVWLWDRNFHPTNSSIPPSIEFREQLLGVENIIAVQSFDEFEPYWHNTVRHAATNIVLLCIDGYIWIYRDPFEPNAAPTLEKIVGISGIVAIQSYSLMEVGAFAIDESGEMWTISVPNHDGRLIIQQVEFRDADGTNDLQ